MLYWPIANKMSAISIGVSEVAVGLVFGLVVPFNFSLNRQISEKLTTIATIFVYVATTFL